MRTSLSYSEGKQVKKCETELNKIILRIMTNGWSKQAYVQGFHSETITLKNM